MDNFSHKFVVANRNVVTPQETAVDKNDVGVITHETKNQATIFFIRLWKKVGLVNNDFDVIDVMETGDSFSRKICNVCHKLLKTSEFAKNQNGKNNRAVRRPTCKKCRIYMDGVNISPEDRARWDKTKPTNAPFECPICRKRTIANVTCKVVLEHNHRTGKPGGWICESCNTGLGRFKDDEVLLKSAIKFLREAYQ